MGYSVTDALADRKKRQANQGKTVDTGNNSGTGGSSGAGSRGSGSWSVTDALKAREKQVTGTIDITSDDLLRRYQSVVDLYNGSLNNKPTFGSNPDEVLKSQRDLRLQASALYNEAEAYRKYLGDDFVDAMTSSISEIIRGQNSLMEMSKYYSQWENEEQYKAATMSTDALKGKLDEQERLIAEKEAELKDLQSRKTVASYAHGGGGYTGGSPYGARFQDPNISGTSDIDKEILRVQQELEALKNPIAYTTKGGQNVTWQMLYDNKYAAEDLETRYSEYSQAADWDEMSKGIETADDTLSDYNIIFSLQQSMMPYDRETAAASGVDMAQWEETEEQRRYIEEKYGVDLHADIYESSKILSRLMEKTDPNVPGEKDFFDNLSYLTDEERAVLSYIYNTQGRDAALQWHEGRERMYADRQSGVLADVMTEYGKDSPFWGSVGSVALGIGGSLEQVSDLLDYVATGEVGHNSFSEASSALRSGTMQEINWEIGNWDAFDFVYSTTMSGIDSYVNGALFGPGAEVMLGLGAAAQATKDAKDRGMSDQQAFWTGISAGVFESIFEHWSIGNFRGLQEIASANVKDIAKNIGKSMLVNASEETLTEIANIVYDTMINGDFSQYETMVRQYVVSGMTEEDAKMKVALELGGQILESGASGALMGAGFGTLGSAGPIVGNAVDAARDRKTTRTIAKDTIQAEGGIDALRSLADEVAGVSDTKIQNRITSQSERVGKKATTRNVGKLYNTVSSAYSAQDKADITKSLTKNGIEEKTAKNLAEAIVESGNGKIITKKQQDLLTEYRDNEAVRTALQETGEGTFGRALKMATFEAGAAKGDLKGFADATRTKQAAPGQENGTAEGKLSVEEKDLSYKASEDGKTKLNGEEVQLNGIRKTEDGAYVVAIGDGESADGSDVEYSSKGQALVYESYTNLDAITDNAIVRNMNAQARSALAMAYDPASGQDGKRYVVGANMVYYYGYEGISQKSLADNVFVKELTQDQVTNAYNEGRKQAQADLVIKEQGMAAAYEQAKEVIASKKETAEKNAGGNRAILENGISPKTMTKQQKASYKLADAVAKAVGTDVHVYLGGAEQGRYEGSTGDIWLNINANHSGQSMMAFTLSHELVHMAKQWSAEKFQAFTDFLLSAYGEKNVPVERLIQDKIQSYKEKGETLTHDKALEEVICDSAQRMLLDTNAVEEMAEFRKQHPDIVQAILDFVKEWLDKIRKALKGAEPGSMEAEYFKQLDQGAQEIAKNLFVEMVMEAGERMSTIREAYGKGTVVAVDESGAYSLVRFDENSDIVDVSEFTKHSYSSLAEAAGFAAEEYEDGTRAFVRNGAKVTEVTVEDIENSPIGAFINFSLEQKDISEEDAVRQKKMFADICTMACKTNDFSMTMQFVGSAVFTGMKANADKQYGTTYDFPSICTKTQAVIDVMSAKMVKLGRGLNTEEITEIYREVFASGNPVPCPECYVFSRWIGIGGLLDNIKRYQDYYGGMTVEEAADAYRSMRAEIEAFAREQGLTFGKAKGALTSKLTKEFNKLTEKTEKAINQGEPVREADRKRLEELEPMMNTVKAMTWLENVYFADSSLKKVNKNFKVPNEVLFDLNNGEAFATQYKEAWAFRTTQGAGYGKAITPYAEARLGEGVLVTNNTTNAIKGKAQGSLNNYFLKQNGKLDSKAKEALMRARLKQKNQAFIGGQRFQSTSDARYENASDYLLAALEMQAMHGMVQVYTKVDGAVPALATWGYSINQSLMPLGGGLDANGNVKDTSVGGMNPKVAFANREKHETAGTITIGVNDNHIRAMFQQKGRDFIIPYHASGGKADVVADFRSIQEGQEKRGKMVRSTDYSRTQSDKILSDDVLRWQGKTQEEIDRIHALREARIAILTRGKVDMEVVRSNEFLSALYDKLHGGEWDGVKIAKSKVESQIYPNEFWNQDVSYEDSAQITEDYLQYCEDLGFLHRFSGLVPRNGVLVPVTGYDQNGERVQLTDLAYKYDGDGKKTGQIEEFFWKVLTDRRMYDNGGKYLPQKVVTLNDTTTETVTEFAKNNNGRQYDKQKAMELAKKIAGTKYALPSMEAVTPTAEQIQKNIQEVAQMSSVYDVDASKVERSGKKLKDIFEEYFSEWGYNIHSDTFGDIAVKNSSIRSELRHGYTPVKIASIEAIPSVIHNGKIVFTTEKHDGDVLRIVVCAPITIGGKDYMMGVMLQRDNQNQRLYLHDVVVEKEASDFSQEHLDSTGPHENNENLFVTNIIQKVLDVKYQNGNSRNSRPSSRGVSTRELLANAFDGVAQTPAEKKLMKEYRDNISKVNDVQKRLAALRAHINKLTKAGGDRAKIAEMNETAKGLAKLIDAYDRKLLEMEASKPLKDVVKRARSEAYQEAMAKGEERISAYKKSVEERFDRGVDNRRRTAMRQKVRKVIRDLDKLLNRGDKKQNVKEGMKDLVSEALKSAEILFIDNYTNEDMIRDGVGTDLTPTEARYMEEARAILEELANLPSGSYEAMMERAEAEGKLKAKLAYRMSRLQDVFVRERARLNRTQVSEVLGKLADAYKSMESSEYSYIKDAFHENVYQYLLMLKDDVGGTIVKDMSLGQLEELHKAYTMVLTTVRNANKMFAANLKETRDNLANRVMFEVRKAGGVHGKWSKAGKLLNSFSWNNQKPVYAFERIGSNTLTTLYQNIRKGQDTWALDMLEANEKRRALQEKYKRSGWDMDKQYKFTSSSGLEFSLNLEQIMSLYAYSKREQAHEHLLKGGFVFDGNTEVVETKHGFPITYMVEDATSYNVSDEILSEIISQLNEDQRAYVDEMQDYLSTTMGEKGNSISMELYGVKLFNEKAYFPLRSAGQYMERAKEADLKKEQGQIAIVNSGFAKATTPKASNPVVLSGFMDVWADHVNEMSMYHSFVLPMEDFRRVYNYSSPHMEGQPSVSVNQVIQNAYGTAATAYIDQLYRDLNGGAVTDPREGLAKAMVGKFKKAAVMASLSVVFQQPSAIGRAFALVNPDYFDTLAITRGVGRAVFAKGKHDQMWAELKKYAPVAMIKEMGYFDTGMGRSAKDFLQAEEYHGLGEKAKAFFTDSDFRDELLSKPAAVADELTWIQIWTAVKKETAAKNPKMDKTSEEFLKLAGERFSEVIDKTQVYDSVLARSANMRSKSLFMNMATSFMAEPTTSINMIEDALRKAGKGQKKAAARTFAAVFCSILINSAFAALVYAARDDDEDETFLEKYLSSFLTEMLDGINPITYYPFLKDIWSLLQGFDVERADMSLFNDLVDVLQNLVKAYAEDTAGMSDTQLDAHNKKIAQAWLKAADSVASLLGIPFKNVRREINGVISFIGIIKADAGGRKTTWSSIKDTALADVADSIPILGWLPNDSKSDKLLDAIISGDEAYIERLMGAYKDEEAAAAAIRSAIKERYLAGDFDKKTTRNYLIEYGGKDVIEAHWMVEEWEFDKTDSSGDDYGKYDRFYAAVESGENLKQIIQEYTENGVDMKTLRGQITEHFRPEYKDMSASERASIKGYLLNAMVACGVDREDAEKDMREWDFEAENGFAYSDRKTAYLNGDITREELRSALINFGGYEAEDAEAQIQVYEWSEMGYDASVSAVKKYNEFCKPAGVSIEHYLKIVEFSNNTENDTDPETGKKISDSAVKKVMAQINNLAISNAQKTAIALSLWKESTVQKYKLW